MEQKFQSGYLIRLADYGTGAVCVYLLMTLVTSVCNKIQYPDVQVIAKDGKEIENMTEAYAEAVGTMINSGEWNGILPYNHIHLIGRHFLAA